MILLFMGAQGFYALNSNEFEPLVHLLRPISDINQLLFKINNLMEKNHEKNERNLANFCFVQHFYH